MTELIITDNAQEMKTIIHERGKWVFGWQGNRREVRDLFPFERIGRTTIQFDDAETEKVAGFMCQEMIAAKKLAGSRLRGLAAPRYNSTMLKLRKWLALCVRK